MALAGDYLARWAYWRWRFEQSWRRHQASWVIGLGLLGYLAYPLFKSWLRPYLLVGIIAIGAMFGWPITSRYNLKLRTLRSGRERFCPECGYQFTGIAPGVPVDRTCGVDFGPRVCPECGVAWPLIPPPTPYKRSARVTV